MVCGLQARINEGCNEGHPPRTVSSPRGWLTRTRENLCPPRTRSSRTPAGPMGISFAGRNRGESVTVEEPLAPPASRHRSRAITQCVVQPGERQTLSSLFLSPALFSFCIFYFSGSSRINTPRAQGAQDDRRVGPLAPPTREENEDREWLLGRPSCVGYRVKMSCVNV